jgi:uncharacterized damage-inducible protein DinB
MKRWVTFIAILGCLAAAPAAAQHEGHQHGEVVMAPGGVKGEWSRNLDYATEKLVQLGEAIPEDKYTWRPADGVRSVSEAFLHAAGANYGIPQFLGVKPPDGFDLEKFEKSTTKKADVIAAIKGSVEHVKAGVKGMPDADMDVKTKWFLGESSKREILFFIAAHNHEHLGQMIAYARMNGIVPPWSKKEG